MTVIRSLSLLDRDFRYLSVAPRNRTRPCPSANELLGTHPWDHGGTPEQHKELKAIPEKIPNRRDRMTIGNLWKYKGSDTQFFRFADVHRVSEGVVEFAAHAWLFPPEIATLTPAEARYLSLAGQGNGNRSIREVTGLAMTTLRSQAASIRNKLSLDDLDQLAVFARLYCAASA